MEVSGDYVSIDFYKFIVGATGIKYVTFCKQHFTQAEIRLPMMLTLMCKLTGTPHKIQQFQKIEFLFL